jgi:hypothetical protein
MFEEGRSGASRALAVFLVCLMAFPILPAGASGPDNEGPAAPRVTDDVNDLIVAFGESYELYGCHTYWKSVQINGTLTVRPYNGADDITGTVKLMAPFIIVGPTGKIVADGRGYGGGGGATCYSSATAGGKGGTGGRGGDGANSVGSNSASGGGGSPNGAPGASAYGVGMPGTPAAGGSGGVYSTYQSGMGGMGYGGGGGGGVSGSTTGGGGGGGGGSGGKDATTQVGGNGGGQYGGTGGQTYSSGYNMGEDALNGGYLASQGNGDSTTDASVVKGSGGGGGGAASQQTGGGGGGGAGGGSVSLIASSDLVMAGTITTTGGGAGGGGYYTTTYSAGRGGGGAGGGVLLSGLTVTVTGSIDTQGRMANILSTTNGGTVKIMYETDQFSSAIPNMYVGRFYKNSRPVMQGLISPEPNSTTELEPVFKWMEANDPEGDAMSYELQVSTSTRFSPPELDVEDLDNTEYSAVKELIGGNFYWRVRARDKVGYGSWSETWRFVTDIVPPSSHVNQLPQYVNNPNFTISWSGYDDSSGVNRYTIYVAEGNLTSRIWIASTANRSAVYEGREGVRFSFSSIAVDRAGNREPVHAKMDTFTTVDITPPTSEIVSITGGDSPLSMVVTWSGKDALSGIRAFNVYLSDNGGDFIQWQKETTKTEEQFDGEEEHEYTFYTIAIDKAGNEEPLDMNKSVTGKLDSKPPVTTLRLGGTYYGSDPTYMSPITPMYFDGTDEFAGYNSTNYAIDDRDIALYNGTMLLEEMPGLHNMTFWGRDKSGNEEAPQSFLFFVDADAPVTFFSFDGPNFITETRTFISTQTIIMLDSTDLSSGINYTEYKLDNRGWRHYDEPLRFEAAGIHTLLYRSVDNVGNTEAEKSVKLAVDSVAPVTKAAPTALTSTLDIYIALSATDYESGVAATFFRVARQGKRNVADFQPGNELYIEASDDHSLDGNYTIQYYSIDNVNNGETVEELVVSIDTDIYLRLGFTGGISVDNARYLVEGKTEPGSTLTINKQPVIVTPDGTFASQVELQPGKNKVLMSIIDPAGNLFTKTYYITYNAPVEVATWVLPLLVLMAAAILVGAGAYLIIRPGGPVEPKPSPSQGAQEGM